MFVHCFAANWTLKSARFYLQRKQPTELIHFLRLNWANRYFQQQIFSRQAVA